MGNIFARCCKPRTQKKSIYRISPEEQDSIIEEYEYLYQKYFAENEAKEY